MTKEIVQEFLRIFQGRSGEERKIRTGFAELGAGDCEGTFYRAITDTRELTMEEANEGEKEE